MRILKSIVGVLVGLGVVAAVTGLTGAASGDRVPTPAELRASLPTPRPLEARVVDHFEVFREAGSSPISRLSDGDVRTLASVRQSVGALPPGSIAAQIDWSRAVGVPVGSGSVWIAPAGDGVCTVIADPGGKEGGIGCSTAAQAIAGEAMTVRHLAGTPDNQIVVAGPVPDGATPPVIIDANGHESAAQRDGNVATAVATTADSVSYGGHVQELGGQPTG